MPEQNVDTYKFHQLKMQYRGKTINLISLLYNLSIQL